MAKQKDVEKVTFESENCVGCRSCEMACSFHHREIFQPSISSIEIVNRQKEQGFVVSFYRQAIKGHLPCNGCRELEVPLCVSFCSDAMVNELRNLIGMSLSGKLQK